MCIPKRDKVLAWASWGQSCTDGSAAAPQPAQRGSIGAAVHVCRPCRGMQGMKGPHAYSQAHDELSLSAARQHSCACHIGVPRPIASTFMVARPQVRPPQSQYEYTLEYLCRFPRILQILLGPLLAPGCERGYDRSLIRQLRLDHRQGKKRSYNSFVLHGTKR